jgi:hypothetical protein
MAEHGRQRPAFPNMAILRDGSPISPQGEFRCKGEQPAVPERVILRPFMPIKLKKAPVCTENSDSDVVVMQSTEESM